MSPTYNSQLLSNSPLVQIAPGDIPGQYKLFDNEIPATGQASIACAIQPKPANSGPTTISLQFEGPAAGIGAGVFQVQDADVDVAGDYTSINFGGATPGQVVNANLNASGVARVELQTAARFLRVLCVTTPGVAVTVRARQQ